MVAVISETGSLTKGSKYDWENCGVFDKWSFMKFMTIIVERLILSFSGASTSTDGRRNASATFLIVGCL